MPTLLFVEDHEATARAVTRLLGKMGYTAVWLSSGRDALAAMRDVRFDAVVLDWMMPGMDGLQVLREMREAAATRDVPVLLYSAADDPDAHGEARRLGARVCVLKSGGFAPLYEGIERVLPA